MQCYFIEAKSGRTYEITMKTHETYEQKKKNLIEQFQRLLAEKAPISLGKNSSNLFRNRYQKQTRKINVRHFNQVIAIDRKNLTAEVEGMTTYETLVRETLQYDLLPTVVPELKSITIGGATTGVGIESSSFKYGFVHETILEMEILLGNGQTVICTKDNEYRDLFFGFPNSYGTFGYVLKLKVKLIPAKKYIFLTHTRYTEPKAYFKALHALCEQNRTSQNGIDYIDGTIFSPNELYITQANFSENAENLSNYKYLNIYYKSIRQKQTDYLTTSDYIWRWDPDWFWCSRPFLMQNRVMRLFFGKFALKSTFYWKIKKWVDRYRLYEKYEKLCGVQSETIIQDVEIPIEHGKDFLDFYFQNINMRPLWVCPAAAYDPNVRYELYLTDPNKLYINFGFWGAVRTTHKQGYHNRLLEQKVNELHGKKSLYSTSFYPEEEFWNLYNKKVYDRLKLKYDPGHQLKNLYEKCVKRK